MQLEGTTLRFFVTSAVTITTSFLGDRAFVEANKKKKKKKKKRQRRKGKEKRKRDKQKTKRKNNRVCVCDRMLLLRICMACYLLRVVF